MSRVYETAVVLVLLSILVCGLAYVASALIDGDASSKQALFGKCCCSRFHISLHHQRSALKEEPNIGWLLPRITYCVV